MEWSQVLTVIAMLGSVLGIWWNLHKFGENIRKESDWRNEITFNLKRAITDISELVTSLKTVMSVQNELLEFKMKQQTENEADKRERIKLWERIDENRDAIKKVHKIVDTCKTCVDSKFNKTKGDIND